MHACGGYDTPELTHMHRYVDRQHVGRSYLLLTTIQSTTEPPAEAVLGWRFALEPSSYIPLAAVFFCNDASGWVSRECALPGLDRVLLR
jgi:hypothetical protein